MPYVLALPPLDPGFELSLASHGMSQGISQTRGPQIIPRATVRTGAFQVGGQWRNITSPVGSGVAAIFLKGRGRLAGVSLEATAAYRIRTSHAPGSTYRAWEFGGLARKRFGPAEARALVEFSPDEFGSGRSLFIEAGPSLDIGKTLIASANVGRRERRQNLRYTSFNAGVSVRIHPSLLLDARFYATNRRDLVQVYGKRVVVSARLSF